MGWLRSQSGEVSSVRIPLDRNLGVIRDTSDPVTQAAHPTSHTSLSRILFPHLHCLGWVPIISGLDESMASLCLWPQLSSHGCSHRDAAGYSLVRVPITFWINPLGAPGPSLPPRLGICSDLYHQAVRRGPDPLQAPRLCATSQFLHLQASSFTTPPPPTSGWHAHCIRITFSRKGSCVGLLTCP